MANGSKIIAGLRDAVAHAQGDVAVCTVRNWEQGRRYPDGSDRALLTLIEREPETAGVSNEVLTELALNSAIALDKQLREQSGDRAVVADFFAILGRIVNISQDHPEAKLISVFDPRKIGVVSRAVRHIESVSTIQELMTKISRMSDTYKDATAPKRQIELIRDFCIALHKELLAGA